MTSSKTVHFDIDQGIHCYNFRRRHCFHYDYVNILRNTNWELSEKFALLALQQQQQTLWSEKKNLSEKELFLCIWNKIGQMTPA